MKIKTALVALLLVLVPVGMAMAQTPTNLYDTLAAAGNYKTFLSLVDKANVKELKSMAGPFTVFAPTDAAFAAVPKATMDKIMGDPAIVRDVVYFHITPGKYMAKDLFGSERMQDHVPHRQRRDHAFLHDGRQIYGE